MNDKIELLIRELAEKLGTTGAHVWEVLVRQAYITATINLIILIIFLLALFFSYGILVKKTTKKEKTKDNPYPQAEWEEVWIIISWGCWCFACLIISIFALTNIPDIVGAILNPEFWAIKQSILQ